MPRNRFQTCPNEKKSATRTDVRKAPFNQSRKTAAVTTSRARKKARIASKTEYRLLGFVGH